MRTRKSLLFFALLFVVGATAASAATLVTNMANATNGNLAPQNTFWLAQKYTTDASMWTLSQVQFRGAKNNAGQPFAVSIYSHDGVSDLPSASIGTFDVSGLTAVIGTQTLAANGTINLAPGTSYWIVVSPGDLNTAFWTQTADLTSSGTGAIPNRLASSGNSGASWSAFVTANNLMIQVDGTSVAPPDTTPDAFSFTDQTNVSLSSTIMSNAITVSGIDSPAAITVVGGSYSINGAAFTNAGGSVNNGDLVRAQHTSSASFSTSVNTNVTIGGVSDTFTSTTEAIDTVPAAFAFTDQTNVPLSSTITSNAITVSGINSSAAITVVGGSYSINGAAFTNVGGSVNNGDLVRAQHTSSASFSTSVDTTVTIGGVSDTFTSTTESIDTTPAAFAFTDLSNVPLSSTVTSNAITVSGINSSSAISVVGGSYSVNGGAFTNIGGSVNNGDLVRVQHTASASLSTSVDTTLTIASVSDIFTSTTAGASGAAIPALDPFALGLLLAGLAVVGVVSLRGGAGGA